MAPPPTRHHGSYMQQDRSLKGKDKAQSYQFMLRLKLGGVHAPPQGKLVNRLKVPCGEIPGPLYAELDDISNKWGHGDLAPYSPPLATCQVGPRRPSRHDAPGLPVARRAEEQPQGRHPGEDG
eukprot:scaffold3339_cov55-Phaeocystis_antarctica.AAC.1